MSSRLLEFKPVPMVVSLRGVKAAARRYRGGLRASLDPCTLKAGGQGVRPTAEHASIFGPALSVGLGTIGRKVPVRLSGAMEQGTGLRADSPPSFAAPKS